MDWLDPPEPSRLKHTDKEKPWRAPLFFSAADGSIILNEELYEDVENVKANGLQRADPAPARA